MSVLEALAILAAGVAAGAINTVVGSGTLITFPVLLGLGYAPVVANVSNTVGLVPGSLAGALGYRGELAGQRGRTLRLGAASVVGGATGALLLLVLPASAFRAIVPVFIVIALVAILAQPRLSRRRASRPRRGRRSSEMAARWRSPPSTPAASTAATSEPPRASFCSPSSAWPSPTIFSAQTR